MGQGYEDHLVTQEADIPEDLDLSTYIGQIASLKEEFLTVMPPSPDPVRHQIPGSSSVPSLDDVFARLVRISSTQTLPSDSISDSSMLVSHTTSRGGRSGNRGRGQRPHCTYCNKLATLAIVAISYMDGLLALPMCGPPGNASAYLTHTSSLGPWILDSRASNHLSGPEYGEDDWHRIRLGHRSLSKFQKMVPRFSTLSSLLCESCQLGKHTRVSFPKRLNNRAKSPFELVHTDIPHFLLFPDQPLYFLPPRVFGCTCFVHILTPGQDKLSAKAMKTHHSFPPLLSLFPVSEVLPLPIVSPSNVMPPRPLQVYHHRPRVAAPLPFAEAPTDSLPIPSAFSYPGSAFS
ncbi:hypothetical protein CK203_096691 [Vitis vinifera]|uniref:GAG-pre-integrase domain-containing protein n=1 Tax=Vitis vinifera TaxID=29760 RepID=A0A438C2X7_VITVI|nr:hypothetical protein CK203_096691 [Vitis vinifera]